MPIYDYLCVNGHRTTQMRPITLHPLDLDRSICGECYQAAELVPSKPSRPILIGSGFHERDYAHGKLGS